jgi:hypothetical protein
MSDYLTNVVARSLERVATVQPRLTSLFEPPSLVGPIFSRTKLVDDRLESVELSETVPADNPDYTQTAITREYEPQRSSSLVAPLPVSGKSSESEEIKEGMQAHVPKHRPVETTMKAALAVQPAQPEEVARGDRSETKKVCAEPAPPKIDPQVVVPAVRIGSANEILRRYEPGEVETNSKPTNNTYIALDQPTSHTKNTSPPVTANDKRAHVATDKTPQPDVPPSAAKRQNKLSERGAAKGLSDPQLENRHTPTRTDITEQRRAITLLVPDITIERSTADRDQRPLKSMPEFLMPDSSRSRPSASAVITSHPLHPVRWAEESGPTDDVVPVINVTIGRVEVRAVGPTPSPPKDRSSTPSSQLMSLDDYLRERAQGDKR